MDYHDDTLTNAIRNRAASQKLFEHWNNANGNGRQQDEFTPRMAQALAASNITTLHSIQQPSSPSSLFAQHSSPSSKPMTTTNILTNGTAATSFDSSGSVIGHHSQQQQIAPQQSNNILLHRSPSGAQRKIRQKAQQQQQNNGIVGGQQNIPQQQMAYRNLIRENGYRSILGEEMGRTGGGEVQMQPVDSATLSVGQLIDRMNRLDPFSNPTQSIDSSSWLHSGGNSIDKMPAFSNLDGQHSSLFPFSNKPTVQVHPLPIPPRHRSVSVISSCSSISQKPIPPPLPPKKHSLMASSQYGMSVKRVQTNRQQSQEEESTKILSGPHWQSSVLSSSSQSSISHSQSSSAETEFLDFSSSRKHQQLTEEKDNNSGQQHFIDENGKEEKRGRGQSIGLQSKPIVEPRKDVMERISQKQSNELDHKIAKPTPFYSPPPSLSSSPSLASLQNSLHFAIENPEKHSCEQLQELDQRRLQSIESLGKKAAEREEDWQLLCRDLEEVGQLKATLFARISQNRHNSELLNRINLFLIEVEKMTELETFLHCQLARLGEATKITRKEELAKGLMEEEREEWEKRLREQINDLHLLGRTLASRERQLDAEMADEMGDAEALHEWIFCKEQLGKLSAEKRQLKERLRDVRNLIDSLEAICLCQSKSD